jgi:hypothetical protein
MQSWPQTITTYREIEHIPNPNINDAEKALILLFELFLIEYLHRHDRSFGNRSGGQG